jgi:hypothetical protein
LAPDVAVGEAGPAEWGEFGHVGEVFGDVGWVNKNDSVDEGGVKGCVEKGCEFHSVYGYGFVSNSEEGG